MSLTLRFVIPLLIIIGAFAYAVVPLVDRLTLRWAVRDLDMRVSLIAKTIQEPLLEQTEPVAPKKLLGVFNYVQTYSMVGLINSAIRLSIRWDQAF